jgi:hypothetical protein
MNSRYTKLLYALGAATMTITALAAPKPDTPLEWTTVINNNDLIPPLEQRTFNSYNQPSVNTEGLVVMRARSRGGPPLGPATHGIYTRDMSIADSEIVRILDRTTPVPQPNNLGSKFVETPSFPRIDMHSATIATRGNHSPVHRYLLDDGSETRAGTTGIYTNVSGVLTAGAAKLGHVPDEENNKYFVPEFEGFGIAFEVFPGSELAAEPWGGTSQSVLIANNAHTLIPGTTVMFGSTAPPNAADNQAVFAGFDNEQAPTLGGIYLAPLQYQPPLTTIVKIGDRVPGQAGGARFNTFASGAPGEKTQGP